MDLFFSDEDDSGNDVVTFEPKRTKVIFDGDQSVMMRTGSSTKAGLPQDKSAINEVIAASTNPRYAAYQARKTARIEARIGVMRKNLLTASVKTKQEAHGLVESIIRHLKSHFKPVFEDTARRWVHLDMDAFFASVEERDDPRLKDVPMAVGGNSMLSTANYVARKFGVTSGMPGYIALKLCPSLRLIPCSFSKYREASAEIEQVLVEMTGCPDPMLSIDEAAFQVTATSLADIEARVEVIRAAVRERTKGLTCTCGIAPTRALAKVCSNVRKPNGQYALPFDDADWLKNFYWQLPAHKINGIGKITAQLLKETLQAVTLGELYEKRHLIPIAFTPKLAEFLIAVSVGLQGSFYEHSTRVDDEQEQKSCSVERTYDRNIQPDLLSQRPLVLELFEDLAEHLIQDLGDRRPKCLGIKWKSVNFEVRQRAITLETPIAPSVEEIMNTVKHLLNREALPDERVRLLGLRASNFFDANDSEDTKPVCQDHLRLSQLESKPVARVDIKCPVCDKLITRIAEDDPRVEAFINVHLDSCLNTKMQPLVKDKIATRKPIHQQTSMHYFMKKYLN